MYLIAKVPEDISNKLDEVIKEILEKRNSE